MSALVGSFRSLLGRRAAFRWAQVEEREESEIVPLETVLEAVQAGSRLFDERFCCLGGPSAGNWP